MQKPDFNFLEELEKIELAEELFGKNLPVDLPLDNPRAMVDYFVLQLRGWGPNPAAAEFLKNLSEKLNSPTLAQGLHDCWRREQISAVVDEIFDTGRSAGEDGDAGVPVRKPRSPKSGSRAAAQSLD